MCEEYEAELRRLGIAMDNEIVVKGLERETLEALEERAREHGISVDEEVKHIVRSTVTRRRMTPDEFESRANAIAALTPKGIKQTDSALLLREDRDR
jgi:plasmid stability protein